jgi:hypothetical protein
MWLGTTDKGLAASLYGPCEVNAPVANGVPVRIVCETAYPFEEEIRMTLTPARSCKFPLYLRIPAWCDNPQVEVNGEAFATTPDNGFVCLKRKWKAGDRVTLRFPMRVQITDGHETPYPQMSYFTNGHFQRPICKETNVNNPYRTVAYGPLLFALPIRDVNPNEQAPDAKWNYALTSASPADVKVQRSQMPARWSWQIDEAPIRLTVPATEFGWQPTRTQPLPAAAVTGNQKTDITLVPYGCTKFRISMFPIGE